jgi:predicted N-formylglutamate amidohydrolase
MHDPAASPSDPPPFDRVDAPGDAPVLVVCDHASAVIPARYGDLGLDGELRRSHVAWDIGAAAVARGLAVRLGAPAVLSGVSRLVIDCNRALGDPGSIPAATCGVAVPGNAGIDASEARSRAETWFRPYHGEIAASLARLRRPGRAPAVVSVHSFTPLLAGRMRPWHVGVLWNRDPRLAVPVIERLSGLSGMVVGDNQPYSGREINYTLDTHAGAAGLPHVSVELRQDLVADAAGIRRWTGLLAEVLGPVLEAAGI